LFYQRMLLESPPPALLFYRTCCIYNLRIVICGSYNASRRKTKPCSWGFSFSVLYIRACWVHCCVLFIISCFDWSWKNLNLFMINFAACKMSSLLLVRHWNSNTTILLGHQGSAKCLYDVI
jgi:hypothetical protein